MRVEKKVPEIRFKGFSGEWGEEKIQELIDRQSIIGHLDGNHGELYPRANEFSNSGIPYISANDFVIGLLSLSSCKYLPIQRALQFKKGIAKDGDILFAHNATVGPVAKLETSYDFVILSTTATYFRCDNQTLINDYLLQALSNNKFVQQYSRVMAQSTRNQVPITVQRNFSIPIPENTYEQTKIGNTFQKLDSLINQQQQKHDQLCNIKKAMLEKMFPKQGETIPEIRFKGFSGEWVNNPIVEICGATFGGGTPSTNDKSFWQGDIPWIQSSDIKNGSVSSITAKKFINKVAINKSATKLISGNSIAIVTRVGVGKLSLMECEYATSQDFLSLSDLKINAQYAVYVIWKQLQSEKEQVQGTSIKGITKDELLGKFITYPEKEEEQTAIGNYFQKLDTLIKQQQQQISKLNHIKQACLRKMFV